MDAEVVGATGVVVHATRGDAGPGEVIVKVRGGSERFIAYSAEPLSVGTRILVIDSRGLRSVEIERWERPTVV